MTTFADIGLNFPLFQAPIIDADVDGPGSCIVCNKIVKILFAEACFECFCAGRVDHTIDTVYGMVRPEDAKLGRTHGIPLNPEALPDLPLVAHEVDPNFSDEHWYSVKCDAESLIELTRTPSYFTWHGEQWQFCCLRPCVFIGKLSKERLAKLADEEGETIHFLGIQITSLSETELQELLQAISDNSVNVYVFRCRTCNQYHTHEDCD